MNEEKINALIDCLFKMVDSFNTTIDRLVILMDRFEGIIQKNDDVFTKMREEFWRKVIEDEVNKNIKKDKKK